MHWLVGNFALIAEILIVFICLANTFDKQISVDIYLIILIISEAVLLMESMNRGFLHIYRCLFMQFCFCMPCYIIKAVLR